MLAERFVQRGAALDILLDVENQFLHRGLFVAVAHDLKSLDKRYAGREHCRELPAENRDVPRIDLAALAALALLADSRCCDALAPKLGAQSLLVGRQALALNAGPALVASLPGERDVAFDCLDCSGCCRSHV